MSIYEYQLNNLGGFVSSWRGKDRSRVEADIASISLESRRIPDPYVLKYNPFGKLLDPLTGDLAENSIDKFSVLGQTEYNAFRFYEKWGFSSTGEEEAMVWISPELKGVYPSAKIVVSTINLKDGQRELDNRAILLDLTPQECIRLANDLQLFSDTQHLEFNSTEAVRGRPIPIKTKNWVDTMSTLIKNGMAFDDVRTGLDIRERDVTLTYAHKLYDSLFGEESVRRSGLKDFDRNGFVGDYKISCPPTAFGFVSRNSRGIDAYFSCPSCQQKIPSGFGITTCPGCGAKKEDYKKCD